MNNMIYFAEGMKNLPNNLRNLTLNLRDNDLVML